MKMVKGPTCTLLQCAPCTLAKIFSAHLFGAATQQKAGPSMRPIDVIGAQGGRPYSILALDLQSACPKLRITLDSGLPSSLEPT